MRTQKILGTLLTLAYSAKRTPPRTCRDNARRKRGECLHAHVGGRGQAEHLRTRWRYGMEESGRNGGVTRIARPSARPNDPPPESERRRRSPPQPQHYLRPYESPQAS